MPHPTRQSCPPEWVIGAELIATASGTASFRWAAEFGRCRGIADTGKLRARQILVHGLATAHRDAAYRFALSAIRCASMPISRNCPVGDVI